MAKWKIWPDEILDHHGDPRQFYGVEGEVFVITAKRISGPDDVIMPRRVIGTGTTRMNAVSNLRHALRLHDQAHEILSGTEADENV